MTLSRVKTRPPTSLRGWRERLRENLTRRTILVGAVVLIVAYLAVVPLVYLVIGTFTADGGVTLSGFGRAYGGNSQAGQMFMNSLVFAVGSAALALLIGTALAFVQVRTDAPGKGLLFAASMVPLIIPGVLYAISWIFLANPSVGILNTLIFQPLFGANVLDIYGMPGMIWVEGTHMAPLAFLLMVGAFQAMDPSLEESASMSGARSATAFRKVTLPLVRPALIAAALLMFVRALSAFEIPTLLGVPKGEYVFTSRIYHELQNVPVDYSAAGAYSIGLLVVAVLGLWFTSYLNRNSRSYQTISGKAFRPRKIALGRARPLVGGLTVFYFVLAVVLPVLALLYTSFLTYYQALSFDALGSFTLENYEKIFSRGTMNALQNSFVLAVGAATIVMLLTAIASWVVVRTKLPGRRAIDTLAFMPLVIPGIVLGVALLFVYLRTSLPIYGTLLILLIAFCTINLPYGMQYASSAMRQISTELEESATVFGASWWTTFRRILLPLASGGIVAGWIYVAIISFRELSAAILVYSPGNEVISVLIWQQYESGSFMGLSAIGILLITILTAVVAIAYKLGASVGLQKEHQ